MRYGRASLLAYGHGLFLSETIIVLRRSEDMMGTITIRATFDGSSFKPLNHVELETNTEYILTVETEDSQKTRSALDILRKNIGSIHGPSDWSDEHDHYIHGTPKRGTNEKSPDIS